MRQATIDKGNVVILIVGLLCMLAVPIGTCWIVYESLKAEDARKGWIEIREGPCAAKGLPWIRCRSLFVGDLPRPGDCVEVRPAGGNPPAERSPGLEACCGSGGGGAWRTESFTYTVNASTEDP